MTPWAATSSAPAPPAPPAPPAFPSTPPTIAFRVYSSRTTSRWTRLTRATRTCRPRGSSRRSGISGARPRKRCGQINFTIHRVVVSVSATFSVPVRVFFESNDFWSHVSDDAASIDDDPGERQGRRAAAPGGGLTRMGTEMGTAATSGAAAAAAAVGGRAGRGAAEAWGRASSAPWWRASGARRRRPTPSRTHWPGSVHRQVNCPCELQATHQGGGRQHAVEMTGRSRCVDGSPDSGSGVG